MSKAIGIGGVFVHLKGDSKELFDWYEKHLGLDFSAYGTGFLDGFQLVTITFKRDDNKNMPYLNFRVDDIEGIIGKLKRDHVQILTDVTEYPYGKFATFKDPFGNPIELWEADRDAYIKLVKSEIEKYEQEKKPKV
jgi:predicted enzyme related to lactoylglutathione lyase